MLLNVLSFNNETNKALHINSLLPGGGDINFKSKVSFSSTYYEIVWFVKLTFEMSTVQGNSIHFRLTNGCCESIEVFETEIISTRGELEPPTFGFNHFKSIVFKLIIDPELCYNTVSLGHNELN